MIKRILGIGAATALAIGALAGCSIGPFTYTVPAETIETQAADVFEELAGLRPDVDCRVDEVELTEGKHLECVLTDPTTGLRYSGDVTLTEVDGTEYKITVVGGSAPLD